MAERRMFAKTIIDSDAFLDMSLSTQALYFHLSMRADDEGFVNNPKKIQRMIGCGDDEMKMLIAKKFIIPFESGVCVIKHWRIHNYIQKDRFKETVYQEEKQHLELKENKAYTYIENPMDTICIQDVSKMDSQYSIGKDSIGKDSIDKVNSSSDEKYKEIYNIYEQLGFGTINIASISDIDMLIEENTFEYVKNAMLEANRKGIRRLDYVMGILKDWKVNGMKTSIDKYKTEPKEENKNNRLDEFNKRLAEMHKKKKKVD